MLNEGFGLLKVHNVVKHFGGVEALCGCSLEVDHASLVGLIGPNGSGKTTLFNLITGIYQCNSGDIYFKGEQLNGLRSDQVVKRGIGRTFQISSLFSRLSILENLLVAFKQQRGENLWFALLPSSFIRKQEEEITEKALEILDFVGLSKLKDEHAGNLSYGQQRLLELARSLMTDPELLLLDEPYAGVNPTMVKELVRLIQELHEERKLSILLIEHNMKAVMSSVEKVIVLDHGKKIAEGTPEEIREDQRVIEAYLGI